MNTSGGNNLSYSITADDSQAQAAHARVNQAFDTIAARARGASSAAAAAFSTMAVSITAAGRATEQALTSAGRAAQTMTGYLVKTSEAVVAVAGTIALFTGALGHYAAAAGSAGTVTDGLVNTYRALRLALSPTLFTASTIAVGILAEETIRLVNVRGRLIEQQAFISAARGIPFADVERVGTTARLSGASPSDATAALYALRQGIGTTGSQNALESLGIPAYARSEATPHLLTEIAQRFAEIPDPVKRAQAAVDIFGEDLAARVLPQLNQRFAESSRAVDDWALGLSETSRNQIYAFRRDMQNLKDDVVSLGTGFQSLIAWAQQGIAVGGAKTYDVAKTGFNVLTNTFESYLLRGYSPVPSSFSERPNYSVPSDDEFRQRAAQEIPFVLGQRAAATLNAAQRDNASLLRDQARAGLAAISGTREYLQSQLSAARSRQSRAAEALEANRGNGPTAGQLTPDQVLSYSALFNGATQEASGLQARLKDIDVVRRQQDALRSSRELAYRSQFDPGGGRDLRSEILKATTFVDENGEVQRYRLLDETRRNFETAFHAYAADLNHKASVQQLKDEEDLFARRRNLEEQFARVRRDFADETSRLEIATVDKAFAHQNEVAGYARDERLQALEIGAPDTVRGRLAVAGARLNIQRNYLLETSINDVNAINRQRDRQLQDLAADRVSGRIGDSEYFDRYKAIQGSAAQDAAGLNDRYTHDVISAQQQAAIESTKIVEDAQHKQFDSLKQSAMGVLDALESHSKNVFQAIGAVIKSSVLTAINEVVSSQIAAGLFRILNPGSSVTFDHTGGGIGRYGRFGSILGGFGLGTQPIFSGSTGLGGLVPAIAPAGTAAFGESLGIPLSLPAADDGPPAADAWSDYRSWGGGDSSPAQYGSNAAYSAAAASLALPLPGAPDQSIALRDAIRLAGGPTNGYGAKSVLGNLSGLKGLVYDSAGQIYVTPSVVGTAGGLGGKFGTLAGVGAGIVASPAAGSIGASLLLGGLSRRSTVGSGIQTVAGGTLLGANIGSHIAGLGLAGGALVGAGASLGADGLKRGGFASLGEDVAGGALIGFQFGGPIGALVGAAIGAAAGTIRLFVPTAREHIIDIVKQTYHITISQQMADQIKQIADKDFRGQYSVAIRSQQIQQLLSLYAQSTGQNFPIAVGPHPFEGAITNGQLYQGATSYNGRSVGFVSSLPTLPGYGITQYAPIGYGSGLGSPVNGPVSLQLDGPATTALLSGVAVQTVSSNPRVVANANNRAQSQNAGRLQNQSNLLSPTTVFA